MGFVPYVAEDIDETDAAVRLAAFRECMDGRRTIRSFDPDRPVPKSVLADILHVAGTAPSGAHKQPWTFVAISDPDLKAQIREACEKQEKRFYDDLAPQEWLDDLKPLGTDFVKEHITDAPWVVVMFAQKYGIEGPSSAGAAIDHVEARKRKHYYVQESVGIAAGFFIAAVRQAGLCTLTHTPSPMRFLADLLERPPNEEAFLLMPVGFPAHGCQVPDLERKTLDRFVVWR